MEPSNKGSVFSTQQGLMMRRTPTEQVYKKTVASKKTPRSSWVLAGLGATLVLLALLVIIVNPIDRALTMVRSFSPGSYTYEQWLRPPVKVSLRFYIFNYTNSEAFVRGEEKLILQEIGPYTYEEIIEIRHVTFNENRTVTYMPTHAVKDDPEWTVGNPTEDIVTVPNFAFLGLASYLSDSSMVTKMAFNVFTTMVKSKPFLTMTVDDYIRGYEEPLLKYAKKLVPGMVPSEKMSYLDQIVNEGENVVTINLNDKRMVTGDGRVVDPFTVDQYNGSPGLAHWGYVQDDNSTHKTCNTLQGLATEGVYIPRPVDKDIIIHLFRKSFCRTVPIVVEKRGVSSKGVPAFVVKMKEDSFDNTNPENSCYCDQEAGPCLPDGLSDIGPCANGLPLAMSFPHFLYGDPSLAAAWEGINPDHEKHGSKGMVDSTYGVTLSANVRVQLNMVMKKTEFNGLARPFKGMVLPAVWIDYCFNDLPDLYHNLVYLAVFVLPVLHYAIFAILLSSGIALLLRVVLCLPNTRTMYRRLSLHRSSARSFANGHVITA